MKSFFDVFNYSWKEYKKNFGLFLVILLLFFVVPSIIQGFLQTPITLEIARLGENADFLQVASAILNNPFLIPVSIVLVLSLLFYVLASVSIVYFSLYKDEKKGLSFSETIKQGGKYFFKYLLYSVVTIIFLFGLYLLFIIPGIIFTVFWIFSPYILIKEKKGIIDSLRTSYNLVKGRWWKTFGYLVMFLIISLAVSLLIGVLIGIMEFIVFYLMTGTILNFENLDLTQLSLNQSIIIVLIDSVANWITTIIFLPLGILFYKNLYLEYNKSKIKEK